MSSIEDHPAAAWRPAPASLVSIGGLAFEEGPLGLAIVPDMLVFSGEGATCSVRVARDLLRQGVALVIDLYRARDHRHPEGHFAWWRFADLPDGPIHFRLRVADGRPQLDAVGIRPADAWANASLEVAADDVLLVHAVVRASASGRILVDEQVHAHVSADTAARQAARAQKFGPRRSPGAQAGVLWPPGLSAHVVTGRLAAPEVADRESWAPRVARAIAATGLPARLWADRVDAGVRGPVRPLAGLPDVLRPDDLIVFVHEGFCPAVKWIAALPQAKLLFHPGFPARERLQAFDAERYFELELAAHATAFAAAFDAWAAPSDAAAGSLVTAMMDSLAFFAASDWRRIRGLSPECRAGLLTQLGRRFSAALSEAERFALQADISEPDAFARRMTAAIDAAAEGGLPPSWRTLLAHLARRCIVEAQCDALAPALAAGEALPPLAARYLLWDGHFLPGERVLEAVALFAEVARLDQALDLVLAGDRPPPSFLDYVRYQIDRTWPQIGARIHMRLGITGAQEQALHAGAEAVIRVGRGGEAATCKAAAGGTRCIVLDPDPPGLDGVDLVMFGRPERRHAEAVLACIGRPRRQDAGERACSAPGGGWAKLIIEILARPRSTGAQASAGAGSGSRGWLRSDAW